MYSSYNNNDQVVYDFTNKQTKGAFLSKVFGMMFICLLITTVVAAGFGYGFQMLLVKTATVDGDVIIFNEQVVTTLVATLIVSAIALLIMSFVLPITFMRGKHNIIVPLMIYVVLMGILLSAFTFITDWVILVESFGITTLIFGTMALLGYLLGIADGAVDGVDVGMAPRLHDRAELDLGAVLRVLAVVLRGGEVPENILCAQKVELRRVYGAFAQSMVVGVFVARRAEGLADRGEKMAQRRLPYALPRLWDRRVAGPQNPPVLEQRVQPLEQMP